MTKKIKVVSILSSIVSQLYTFALLALGVALVVSSMAQATLSGWLADIDVFYTVLASYVGFSKIICVAITTLFPAVVIEIASLVQAYSPRVAVDNAMLTLTVVFMMLCTALFGYMMVSLYVTATAVISIAIACVPVLLQIIVLAVLASLGKKHLASLAVVQDSQSQQCDSTEEVEESEAVAQDATEQETTESSTEQEAEVDEHTECDTVEQTTEVIVEQTEVDTAEVMQKVVEAEDVDSLEDIDQDTLISPADDSSYISTEQHSHDVPYQPQELQSTSDILVSVYGQIDTNAPVNNKVLAKLDKLATYRDLGLITVDEYDKLSASVLHDIED